jgi:hypothetical protein
MKVKNEMVEFVDENFELIRNQFIKQEEEHGGNCFLDEVHNLNISEGERLVDIINECSLGVDFEDDEDTNNLFNMVKAMKEVAN